MLRPRSGSFTDIPITSIAGVDRYGDIQSVLATHDRGLFRASAMLWDAMKRDDRIHGVTSTRVGALMAAPLEIKPASSKAKAARVAKLLAGDGEDDHGLWERFCPASTIRALSNWGTGIGLGLAQILWETSVGSYLPRLRVWHPQAVYWDWSDRRYMVLAREGMVPLPRLDEDPRGDGNWFLWMPYGYQYGWFDSLLRPLANKYLMRAWDYRDWARSNERQGMATFGAIYPQSADKEVKDKFLASIANLGSDAAVALPDLGDNEGKFDLKMIESTTRNWETFKEFKMQLDTDIAVAVLGQNLTTEVKEGSRAAAQVQNLVRIDKAIEDAGIADAIRLQVLSWWCLYNFGDPELAPRPAYQVEPPDDELKEATSLKMLGDALNALKTATAPIDVRTVLDRAGVPMLSEEEEAAQKAVVAEEAQARLEAMQAAGGAGQPGKDNTEPPAVAGGNSPATGDKAALAASYRDPLPPPVRRYEFQGLPIAVENPAGSIRQWREPGPEGGTIGTTTMLHDYGYIEGHVGSDDEELDCYVGHDESAPDVHVVHQLAAPDFKKHDEDKVFLGFPGPAEAKAAYLAHRNETSAFGGMSTIPLFTFKAKLKRRTGTGKIRATAQVELVIREEGGKWHVYGEDGEHLGGPYATKAEAEKRLRQVEWHKAHPHAAASAHLERHRETVAALLALADRATSPATLRAPRSAAGTRRARLYPDGVAERARALAARSLAVDLAAIKEEIDACQSFSDLRQRIVHRFRGMDPRKLAAVMEKARIMANLGGRLSALKEI